MQISNKFWSRLLLALILIVAGHIGQSFAATTSIYAGTYSGSFSGADQGTWTATVSSLGEVTLQGSSGTSGETFIGHRADFLWGADNTLVFPVTLITYANGAATGTTIDFNPNPSTGVVSGTWTNIYVGGGSFSGSRTSTSIATTLATTTTTSTSTTTTTSASTTTTTLPPIGVFHLFGGWNLLGHHGDTPIRVDTAFVDTAKVSTVWSWKAAAGKWAFYTPLLDQASLVAYAAGKGYEVLTTVYPGDGFWVNAKVDHTITYGTISRFKLDRSYLPDGWNLVATGEQLLPGELDAKLGGTLGSPSFTSMWTWNPVSGKWYFYAPSLAGDGTLAAYVQTKGYLDFGAARTGSGSGFWLNMNSLASSSYWKGIRPNFGWIVEVTPAIFTYYLAECSTSTDCRPLSGPIYDFLDPSNPMRVSATFNGVSYGDLTRQELHSLMDGAMNTVRKIIDNVWSGEMTPEWAITERVIGGALASATGVQDFESRLVSGFTGAGFPAASGVTTAGGTGGGSVPSPGAYLCPTTKVPFDQDWIQSHGSYWAAQDAHDQGDYGQEAKYCAVAKALCDAVVTNPSSCPG